MYKNIFLILCIFLFIIFKMNIAAAATQNECAIWLCLPAGFPEGCQAAKSAMYQRLQNKKTPLPDFSNCSTEGYGNYKLGYEPFLPCSAENTFISFRTSREKINYCANTICLKSNQRYRQEQIYQKCFVGYVQKREKPNFVEMWINDKYQGKYFY